jgi:uncharacterized membrane protein YgdD (TMEM256/DUF423 family)
MYSKPLPTAKAALAVGSIAMMMAVAAGAFGAHVLKKALDPELMAIYQTAVQYHIYHALGLLVIGLLSLYITSGALLRWSSLLMIIGIVLFSGSLYALSLSGVRWFGAITPIGGIALLGSWLLLAIAVLKNR